MSEAFTPSEGRASSSWLNPPETRWPTATECKGLEDETGADVCLTGYTEPLRNMRQVSEQLQATASVLCQVKVCGIKGSDLASSIADGRINDSLMRMQYFLRSIGVPEEKIQSKCVLVRTGYHLPNKLNALYVGELRYGNDGPYIQSVRHEHTHINYLAIETMEMEWSTRGGSLWPTCPTVTGLPAYLDRCEATLKRNAAEPIKEVYPQKKQIEKDVKEVYGGLQMLVDPSETVKFFASMQGVGMDKELAKRAVRYYIEEQHLTGIDAQIQMSSPAGDWFRGWGKAKQQALARALAITQTKAQTIDNTEED